MSVDSACVNDTTIDLDSTKVYTYCGNCKGVRDLIDKHNALKRSYESCLRLNEILALKVLTLETRSGLPDQENALPPLRPWNEKQERTSFQKFLVNMSQAAPKRHIKNRSEDHGDTSIPEGYSEVGRPKSPRHKFHCSNG